MSVKMPVREQIINSLIRGQGHYAHGMTEDEILRDMRRNTKQETPVTTIAVELTALTIENVVERTLMGTKTFFALNPKRNSGLLLDGDQKRYCATW